VESEQVILGRRIGPEELALVRDLLGSHPDWHRTQLSRALCHCWGWHNEAGQPKDMACRTLLLRLERGGLIVPPARRGPSVNDCRNRDLAEVVYDREPVACALGELRPIRVEPLDARHPDQALLRLLLHRHHYLGLRRNAGQNLRYLARDRQRRPLACLLFGSAAWKVQARDRFIGWDGACRRRGLARVVDNSRFLILPWVRVPHLASHLLGRWRAGSMRIGRRSTVMAWSYWKRSWIVIAFTALVTGLQAGFEWASRRGADATTSNMRCVCQLKTSTCWRSQATSSSSASRIHTPTSIIG
jgi:hypothetical protein